MASRSTTGKNPPRCSGRDPPHLYAGQGRAPRRQDAMTGRFDSCGAIATKVRSRKTSALAVTEAALARIAAENGRLNGFTAITADRARADAVAVDAVIAAGGDPGPLAGVPFAVKNLFDIKDVVTLAGARISRDDPPATADATLIARLTAAGAVLVGALNMGEYAYDFTGENVHDGPSRNPHDPSRMSGGSSGGSGTAVGAAQVPLALGSDTNGSIRVPSSLCGIFGLKPTYGALSRTGSFPFVASLDHLGPFARTATDLALAFDAMAGPDPSDPACDPAPRPAVLPEIDKGVQELRIAVADDYFDTAGLPEAEAAVSAAAEALAATAHVTIPEARRARAAAYVITASEGARLHLDRLRRRAADFDPAVRDRLIAGATVPAGWYLQAQKFRHWYRTQLQRLFDSVDLVIAPATPCSAPAAGQKTMVLRGEEMLVRPNLGLFTQPISFAGLPVAAVPIESGATSGGMPIGVQLIAAPGREDLCLRAARALEQAKVAVARVPTDLAAVR